MPRHKEQKKLIEETDWDNLIILDACRYDYFKEIYKDYLTGELTKTRSPSYETTDWCKKMWNGHYQDIIYVSSNPRINSKTEVEGYKGSDHFPKIIDVWDWGWDKESDTVLPKTVKDAAINSREKYSDKKLIIHFMQPHFPYLGFELTQTREGFFTKLRANIGRLAIKLVGRRFIHRIRNNTPLAPFLQRDMDNRSQPSDLKLIVEKHGSDFLKELYSRNMKRALTEVSELVEFLSGKNIVTSDHGELLGEDGCFEHDYNHPKLHEVPWLEVI